MREEVESKTPYPEAPWRLRGGATCLLHLLPVSRAKAFVPAELSIVSLLPGRTLGALYLATYRAGSILEYHELIVVSALVRDRHRVGGWISHIYVDSPRSAAGGREIWGLPKQLARFTREESSGLVAVRQGEQLLCRFRPGRRLPLGRLPVLLPALSRKGGLLWFHGTGTARLGITSAEFEVPESSPFHALGFGQSYGVQLDDLRMVVHAPTRSSTT